MKFNQTKIHSGLKLFYKRFMQIRIKIAPFI